MKKSVFMAIFLAWGVILTAAGRDRKSVSFNIVRNGEFKPGLDKMAPAYWSMGGEYIDKVYSSGFDMATDSQIKFTDKGMTLVGPIHIYQYYWNDMSPAYQVHARIKQEDGKGSVISVQPIDNNIRRYNPPGSTFSCKNTGKWEDISFSIEAGEHFGVALFIRVPKGVKLSLSFLKMTPAYKSVESRGIKIASGNEEIPLTSILVSSKADYPELLAAHELQVILYLMSGAKIPILANDNFSATKGHIILKNVPQSKDIGKFGYQIVSENGTVSIQGNAGAGLIAGTLAFLEKLGTKFYCPGIYDINKSENLLIPAMKFSKTPAFELADGKGTISYDPWKFGYLYPDSFMGRPKQEAPLTSGWVHPALFLAPPYLYAKTHPEYYALYKNKRLSMQDVSHKGYLHLCLGSTEVQRIAAERLMKLIERQPERTVFSVAQADGRKWCECEKCQALDVQSGLFTDRLVSWANSIAKIVAPKYPDKKLLILAYGVNREELPLKVKPHPNVMVMYAQWPSSWPIWENTFCEKNKYGQRLLAEWNHYTNRNLLMFTYPVNIYENIEKIRYFAYHAIKGFYQCGWRGEFPEVTVYTTGRLIWDPDANAETIVNEVIPHIYGKKAAPYMRDYINMFHDLIREITAGHNSKKYRELFDCHSHKLKKVPLDYGEKAYDLLTKAEDASNKNETQLYRIQRDKTRLMFAMINAKNTLNTEMNDKDFSTFSRRLAELVTLARKTRFPFATYRVPFSEWLFQITGKLDFSREPYKWSRDKKIDEFLKNPEEYLKRELRIQEKTKNGWKVPLKGFLGGKFIPNYQGRPAVVVRRKSSVCPRANALLYLDSEPAGEYEFFMRGMDHDKEGKAVIAIQINNQDIFRGPTEFDKKWSKKTYKIPGKVLRKGENLIKIVNITEDLKDAATGEAGPAEEAMNQNYNWGWFIFGTVEVKRKQ